MKSISTVMIPQTSAALTTIMMTTTILGIDSFLVIIIHRITGVLRTIRGTGGGAVILIMILSGAVHTIQRCMRGWLIQGMGITPIMEATTAMGTIPVMARLMV